MTIGRWSGQGEGTLVNPFIITMPVDYNVEEPFYIRLDNNFVADTLKDTYFRFNTDPATTYLLAVIVKDVDSRLYFQSANAILHTTLLTSIVDYTDGPFAINVFAGVHYILRQQVLSFSDVNPIDVPQFLISALEPAARGNGDFWFDLELQVGQEEEQFMSAGTNFIVDIADLTDAENTPFVIIDEEVIINEEFAEFADDTTEEFDAEGNYIANEF